jgi:hypothetical protein
MPFPASSWRPPQSPDHRGCSWPGLAGHGFKDVWQPRSHFVANTRLWPFWMVVEWVVAAIIVAEIAAGVHFG